MDNIVRSRDQIELTGRFSEIKTLSCVENTGFIKLKRNLRSQREKRAKREKHKRMGRNDSGVKIKSPSL